MPRPTKPASEQPALGSTLEGPFAGLPIRPQEERDPRQVQRDILGRMAGATSIDELFAVHDGDDSRRLEGKRLRVLSVEWDIYEADDGPVPLAHVKANDLEDGSDLPFRTTASNLCGFLAVCEQNGWLPQDVKIEGSTARSGNRVLHFTRV